MVEKLTILMHNAHPAAHQGDVIAAHPAHVLTKQHRLPRRGGQRAVAQFQKGGFAGP